MAKGKGKGKAHTTTGQTTTGQATTGQTTTSSPRPGRLRLRGFDFFVLDPNKEGTQEVVISGDEENPTTVATVKLNVNQGDKVWLNGVFHVDNDDLLIPETDLNVRIFRGTPANGEEIYKVVLEVGPSGVPGDKLAIPFSHVDVIQDDDTTLARYTVTVNTESDEINSTDVHLIGPTTFTALSIG
ncbi:hypothetical protein [Aneurinibacillus tyrosinisolvens]|uniref:hypothetical protein n=1 Tax=Aneurinibacillus tyrosinisolvens TaxID=1443435 RepID=UPI00063FAEF0|nr:hypothetical protein [Aneurinibacillus tyrosinisolvens]